jgi:hypothetical protein
VVRLLLEAYYEPQFSSCSHGFRPRRGCHTALSEVARTWTGTTWFIEGDIFDCYGSFDHQVMLTTLAEKIRDNRFLRLVRSMLQAGYLEDWQWNATLSGVPQGGVVSPVMSNIYLHRLDSFAGTVLIPEYTRGRVRKPLAEHARVRAAIGRARKRGDRATARQLRKRLHGMPSGDPRDPGCRRLHYCRYADDILFGFAGPKAEAEEIKQRLAAFLRDELKLELSADKTLITHARTQAARFLGYEITVLHNDRKVTRGRRSANGTVSLRVPAAVIKAKSAPYLARGKPARQPPLISKDDHTVVAAYGARYRGIVQYYLLAGNVARLDRLHWVMETSLLKTLANKHRSSVTKMARKYKATTATPHGPRKCLEARIERSGRKPLAAVRRHSPEKAERRGHLRPRPCPGHHPSQRAGHPAPGGPVRDLRARGRGARAPGPQTRRPRQAGAATARVGGTDGEAAAQDPYRLPVLPRHHPHRAATSAPRVVVTRERCAVKAARTVRAGGRGKGPAQQAPRPRPTSTLRYGLSYRDVEELLAEREVTVDHVTIYRWVQRFTP